MTTHEEWRVTGQPPGYPPYAYTWSSDPESLFVCPDPEATARQFVADVQTLWDDGPHLIHRTVTRTEWEEVPADA